MIRRLRIMLIDWRLGWNEAARDDHRRTALRCQERIDRARDERARLDPSPWSRSTLTGK